MMKAGDMDDDDVIEIKDRTKLKNFAKSKNL